MADWSIRWEKIETLGSGGQGTVYRVRDTERRLRNSDTLSCRARGQLRDAIRQHLLSATSVVTVNKSSAIGVDGLIDCIVELVRGEDHACHAALKVLHKDELARDLKTSKERLLREIKAMQSVEHPNLLKVLQADTEDFWYVSEFHPKGTLAQHRDQFTGNPVAALKAFRPLVDAVAKLHKAGWVHRDIKAENIFLASDNQFVLGDFGLVIGNDASGGRLSKTLSNVGSWDWMPTWAMNQKMEEVKPAFDVFTLGKLLWWMVSGLPIKQLQFWYFDRPELNVEHLYPNTECIGLINPILAKCVVEVERQCRFASATELLSEVDNALLFHERHVEPLSDSIQRTCSVCALGKYVEISDRDRVKTEAFGFRPEESRQFKIYLCGRCGHVQLFTLVGRHDTSNHPAWQNK